MLLWLMLVCQQTAVQGQAARARAQLRRYKDMWSRFRWLGVDWRPHTRTSRASCHERHVWAHCGVLPDTPFLPCSHPHNPLASPACGGVGEQWLSFMPRASRQAARSGKLAGCEWGSLVGQPIHLFLRAIIPAGPAAAPQPSLRPSLSPGFARDAPGPGAAAAAAQACVGGLHQAPGALAAPHKVRNFLVRRISGRRTGAAFQQH